MDERTAFIAVGGSLLAASVYALAADLRTRLSLAYAVRAARGEPVLHAGPILRLICQLIELLGFGFGQWVLYRGLSTIGAPNVRIVAELIGISLIPLAASLAITLVLVRVFRSYGLRRLIR